MITKFGKRFLTNYIAGNSQFNFKELALGIGSTAPNVSGEDTKLEFEFYRLPVSLGSFDIQTNNSASPILARDGITTIPAYSSIYYAIFKSTIPQDISGVISEIGLYPGIKASTNNYDSKFVTSFENNFNWLDTSGFSPQLKVNNTTEPFTSKIGESMVQWDVNTSTSKEYKNSIVTLDISGYSVNDTLVLAYKKKDTNVTKIRVKFYSSDTQYYYADFTPLSGTGDKIQSVSVGTLLGNVSSPAPDPTNITKIGIEVTAGSGGSTTVYFDGLRVNDEDTFDPLYGLISRSVLTTPLIKPSGRPVDIEYKLQLEF
jgi:hypothetical protein